MGADSSFEKSGCEGSRELVMTGQLPEKSVEAEWGIDYSPDYMRKTWAHSKLDGNNLLKS